MTPMADGTWLHRLRLQAEQLARTLRRIDGRDPPSWPLGVQVLLLACLAAGVVAGLWVFVLADESQALESELRREQSLRADFARKVGQAAHLDGLRRQRADVRAQLQVLERQLPGKAEIDALLSDINQAGLTRGLYFELFRPGPAIVRSYFVELPVTLKVTGRFHDLGRFAADLAALPRIVVLHQIQLSAGRDGQLTFEAVLRAYRSLEPEEAAPRPVPGSAEASPRSGAKP